MDPPSIVVYDELTTDYVLDTDLVVDGRREHRIMVPVADPTPVAENVRPALVLGTRVYVDQEHCVRLCLPLGEPTLKRVPGCVVVRRMRREIAVKGDTKPLWRLLQIMDGLHTTAELITKLPDGHQGAATKLLNSLAAVGAVDSSDRPIGRFLHTSTKKGVLPGGKLDVGGVLQLVTDGEYRTYPNAARLPVHPTVPELLVPFHAITRTRRSYRDYNGAALGRADFEALLTTACGCTGTLRWAGREVKLRAYPSSGGLYAVEIYPVVFAVEGLDSAVYHYRPDEETLEVVQPDIYRKPFLDASLPAEREMLTGVAIMVCLTGVFTRHERKYGEGGYRMMAAEAGHISQNLILAATALGLHARPFGGVFDDLLNRALGFNTDDEQFLLSVIVGYTGDKP